MLRKEALKAYAKLLIVGGTFGLVLYLTGSPFWGMLLSMIPAAFFGWSYIKPLL